MSEPGKTTELLYQYGSVIGTANVGFFNGVRIDETHREQLQKMFDAALKDNIHLNLASGLRTQSEQIFLRQTNVKDKSKQADMNFIMTAPSSEFYPVTGKPGFSNHQNGRAFDISTTDRPMQYKWLVLNAHNFGFIRTVESETWHWEYLPKEPDMFKYVPKGHPTWQHLV